jgi:hypothetical protein
MTEALSDDDPLNSDEDILEYFTDGSVSDDRFSDTSSIYSWNGHYGDLNDIEATLAEPMLHDMEDDPAGLMLHGNSVMHGNTANVQNSIARPLYSDGDVLQPNENWMESEQLQEEDGLRTKLWHARRKDYLMRYAAAKRLEMPLRQRDLGQLLQYSLEAMRKSADRQLRHSLKTENLDRARLYYTNDTNLTDAMRHGVRTLARQKLKNSPGQKYLDTDVIDKILRYVDPQMSMPGVPHDLNENHHVVDPTLPSFPLAALGSRDEWLSRQHLHPMYREPYQPFLPPDRPIDEQRLHELQQIEDQDLKSVENMAMRSVYQSPDLVKLINSFM